MNYNCSLIFVIDISADIGLKHGLDRTGCLPSQGKSVNSVFSFKSKGKV